MIKTPAAAILVLLLSGLFSGPRAQAVALLKGMEMTRLCASSAKAAAPQAGAVRFCTAAIENEAQVGRSLAGLYVNRGVLELRGQAISSALKDFDTALQIEPTLGEAWVNHGAALLASGEWAQGKAEIDKGLLYAPDEPEKAYFNRGLADEHLNDVQGAYRDYRRAQALAPDWPAPKEELKRFHVEGRPAS
jgi:tetratricopeptide (TPR) repeat protein